MQDELMTNLALGVDSLATSRLRRKLLMTVRRCEWIGDRDPWQRKDSTTRE